MYGLINQALKELVESHSGPRVWSEICASAGISAEDFDSLLPYEDSVTYTLVGLASEKLGMSSNEILRMFGVHWITFTAKEGYGDMMELFGRDLRTCLRNLNRMHGHMGAMMPNLHPPRFVVEERDSQAFTLHYYSDREGLGPLVFGIVEGLAAKFQEQVRIKHVAKHERSDHDEFDVSFESA